MIYKESNDVVSYDVDYNSQTGYYNIVASNGDKFGEYLSYDDALEAIDELPRDDEDDTSTETKEDEVRRFMKETGLHLTKYGSRYIETSGVPYSRIIKLVRGYNRRHNTHITEYNDDFKDATFISFK